MSDYFSLQLRLLHRRFRSWQLAPWLVWSLGALLFTGLGWFLLDRNDHFSWLVVAAGWSSLSRLGGAARNDWLRNLYEPGTFRRIRLVENGLVALPFGALLLVRGFWAQTLVLGLGAAGLAYYVIRRKGGRGLPTPFSRRPFEQAIGFRKFWWVLLVTTYLLFNGLRVGNYELGAFALVVTWLTGLQCYARPEPAELLAAYTLSAQDFLRRKYLWGARQLLWWVLPFAVPLFIVFPERWLVTLVLGLLAFPNFAVLLLLKYFRYPDEQSVMEGIVFALGLFCPPVLPVIIYVYYQRAVSRLHLLLP